MAQKQGIRGAQHGHKDNAILKQETQNSEPGQKRRAGTLIGVDRKGPQREVGILEPPIVSKPAFGMPLYVEPPIRGGLPASNERRVLETAKKSALKPGRPTSDLPHEFRAHSEIYDPSPPKSHYAAQSEARWKGDMLAPPNPQKGNLDGQIWEEGDRAYVLRAMHPPPPIETPMEQRMRVVEDKNSDLRRQLQKSADKHTEKDRRIRELENQLSVLRRSYVVRVHNGGDVEDEEMRDADDARPKDVSGL